MILSLEEKMMMIECPTSVPIPFSHFGYNPSLFVMMMTILVLSLMITSQDTNCDIGVVQVRHVLALAVDPLTENIFYILDLDR